MVADSPNMPPPQRPRPAPSSAPASADSTQIAGTHYNRMAIQPWNFIAANEKEIGFFEGNIIAYICRWRRKGGVEDLRNARHYVDKMIELVVNFDWPNTPLTEEQVKALLVQPDESRDRMAQALKAVSDGFVERGRGGDYCADTTRVPTTDDAAVEQAVEATRLATEALKACAAIQQGIVGKPFPLHTVLRTTIKHTESSLLTALRDLQAFRDIVRENNAHE